MTRDQSPLYVQSAGTAAKGDRPPHLLVGRRTPFRYHANKGGDYSPVTEGISSGGQHLPFH